MHASSNLPARARQALWPQRPQPLAPELAPLQRELRTDHAGELGATWIYRGVLCLARDPALRHFAQQHLATEREHLRLIEQVVPWRHRSRLALAWRAAGFLTGALPALAGPRAVYATIDAVETFVDTHYAQQLQAIEALDPTGQHAPLRALHRLLQRCWQDELAHRDDARARQRTPPGLLLRGWCRLVGAGSAAAVRLSRWV